MTRRPYSDDFEQGAGRWEPTDPAAWTIAESGGSRVFALVKQSAYKPPVRTPSIAPC